MKNEEQKKLITNTIINILMIFNPYKMYFYFIEIIHSIGLAFRVLGDALGLYIKSLLYLLIPVLLLINFQLLEPVFNKYLSAYIQAGISSIILNFIFFFILWPLVVSPIYLSLHHVKIGTQPMLADLFKSSRAHFFKIVLLRLLVLSVSSIVVITILGLYIYMMPKEGSTIHYSYKSIEPTAHLASNYLIGNILLFISLYSVVYLLLRLFLAEWLIVLKGYGPFGAIKESWQSMSGSVSVAFFSLIIIWLAAIALPHLLNLVLPRYSEMIAFIIVKLFGAYYCAVVISIPGNFQDANSLKQ